VIPSPRFVDFGEQQVGTISESRDFTLTNTCAKRVLVTGVGTQGAFALGDESTCYGHWLDPAESCIESAKFYPYQTGEERGRWAAFRGYRRLTVVKLRGVGV